MRTFSKNKFNAKSSNGFPSKLEAAVYQILLLEEKAGVLSDIKRQDCVRLTDANITWKVDFSAIENGKRIWIEAKGVECSDYRIKKKLWEFYGPGELRIYKGNYKRPMLSEIVVPSAKVAQNSEV